MKLSNLLVITGIATCAGCSQFGRSPDSGYGNQKTGSSGSWVKRSSKVSSAQPEETPVANFSSKARLKQLENSLSTRKETEQYSKALPWFQNDYERVQFLSLPGFEARQKWLTDKGFNSRSGSVQTDMKDLIEAQDIAVGMPQSVVRQSWGDPDTVEVSGNPQFKNERWRYNRYVSSQDGYKSEHRTVYFEGGKVVAWELE
ncbi:MAG: hypothetical protein ACAH59_01165 [Pseudobdellovibrionaceae bacterium]